MDPKKRKVLKWVAVGAAVIVLALVGFAVAQYMSIGSKMQPPKQERARIQAVLDAPPAQEKSPFVYVLLLGNDHHPGERWTRTDTILLARLDTRDKAVLMLSIPRDTYTEVRGHGLTKINGASSWGGVPLTIETVKRFTGLPVNHYVEIDFQGFQQVVDDLGGVDMYVSRPVNYGNGISVHAGQQHLNGTEALEVMRNRHAYGDGDFARMNNQQLFLKSIARKMAAPSSLVKLPGALNAVADHVQSDLSASDMISLVRDYRVADSSKVKSYTIPGQPKMIDKVSYIVPDMARAKALFDAIRAGQIPPASLGYRMGID
jgi:LCP family protein required for cell wall assembly